MLSADVLEGADPGHQSIPSGWPTTLSGLNTQIYT
jgi:arabinogalactan endo-1,4-beta-galactosidase